MAQRQPYLILACCLCALTGCAVTADDEHSLFSDDEVRELPYPNDPELQAIYLRAYWDGLQYAFKNAPGVRFFDDYFQRTPAEKANARGYWDADEDAENLIKKDRKEMAEFLRGQVEDHLLELFDPKEPGED